MYTAWYSRGESGMHHHHHQMGQLYHPGAPMIKTEAGVNSDCMMAVDYGASIKKASASSAFVWSGGGGGGAGNQDQNNTPINSTGVSPGGAGGGSATQGLVHWMSVMAEHMGASGHHDPTHYALPPWNNGAVDHCGQQKEFEYGSWSRNRNVNGGSKQGYEAKMNNNEIGIGMGGGSIQGAGHQKTDHHHHQTMSQMLYGAALGPTRSGSSSSSPVGGTPGGPGSLLVVPQPLGAGKNSGKIQGLHSHSRKYHCKMCPQVCYFN